MLSFALLALGAAYLESAPLAGTYARAPAQPVLLRGPATAGDMALLRPVSARSYAQTGSQDQGFENGILGAAGFAVGAALALQVSRTERVRSRMNKVVMRGWNDNYSGDSLKSGGVRRGDRPGRGNSAFEQEMQAAEDAYNKNLTIVSAVLTVGFLAFLFVQVKPFL